MLINKDTPNIFDLVPEDTIASIYEDKGSRKKDRINKINNVQKAWGNVGWKDGYTNAGTFILSKQHRDIFKPHKGKYWLEWGSADIHMSYNILKGYVYNHIYLNANLHIL